MFLFRSSGFFDKPMPTNIVAVPCFIEVTKHNEIAVKPQNGQPYQRDQTYSDYCLSDGLAPSTCPQPASAQSREQVLPLAILGRLPRQIARPFWAFR